MAEANMNSGKRTSHVLDGGRLVFARAAEDADTHVLLNQVDGTLRLGWGVRLAVDPRTDSDHGNLPTVPRRGPENPWEIDIDVQYHASVTSDELESLLCDDDPSSTGFVQVFDTVVVEFPDYDGASTGVKWTFSNVYLREQPTVQAGTDADTLSVRLGCTKAPVRAALS